MISIENLIIGGGIAGLAVGLRLKEEQQEYLILERNSYYGGLCSSFCIDGFIFDNFVHLSFTKNDLVRKYFDRTPFYAHIPNPYNYYHGMWIKHPAINNLYPLSDNEKHLVNNDLKLREKYASKYHENYEYWLRYQFGDYFSDNFPLVYTRKYWQEEAKNIGTKWIGNRVYQPTYEEIMEGMKTSNTPVTYYAKEMRYPTHGGFESFIKGFAGGININLNEEVVAIDLIGKTVTTNKNVYSYQRLFSSLPLPEWTSLVLTCNKRDFTKFKESIDNLHWTSGYMISLGMKGKIPRNDLWDYIYDEDIEVSRYYSPSIMSSNTVPQGCYSIQAEVYTRDGKSHRLPCNELLDSTIKKLDCIGALRTQEVVVKDIKFSKYCNVLFDHEIYKNREIVLNYLEHHDVISIGRFGLWDYYWSDQSFLSGYNATDGIITG